MSSRRKTRGGEKKSFSLLSGDAFISHGRIFLPPPLLLLFPRCQRRRRVLFFLPGCSKESLLPPLGLGRQDETDIMHEKKERKKAWGEGRTAKSIALV